MKPRPLTIITLACLLISCGYAQKHPYRTGGSSEAPPLPTIRLTQAVDEDLNDVLGTAQDLLDQLESDDTTESDLDTVPRPSDPNLPRTLDEYRPSEPAGDTDQQLGDFAGTRTYEDVQADPYARRRNRRPNNTPYSLGAILGPDDGVSPCCEREFCRIMWSCAGGRCLDVLEQHKRNMRRSMLIRRSCNNPECLRGPFSVPFVCPQCRQAHYQQNPHQGPYAPQPYPYNDYMYEGQPTPATNQIMDAETTASPEDFSKYEGYRVIDDRKVTAGTSSEDAVGRSSWSQRGR